MLAMVGLFALHSAICAQPFQLVHQGRWVRIEGSASIVGQNGQPGTGSDSRFLPAEPGANFDPFSGTESFQLDVTAPDGTAAAHLLGSVSQTSSIATNAIRYEGSAAMSASTSGTPGAGSTWSIQAFEGSFLAVVFDVAAPVTAVLSLHANGPPGIGSFAVLLHRQLPSGSELIYIEQGAQIAPHEVRLALEPGTYDVRGDLGGGITNESRSGVVDAGFSLVAAIPEPQTWSMLAAGLVLLGVGRRLSSRGRHRALPTPAQPCCQHHRDGEPADSERRPEATPRLVDGAVPP
jgi:hypothetical protein